MTQTSIESSATDAATLRGHAFDAARHAAHISHEGRLLKSLAADAMEDGAYAMRRTIKSVKRGVAQVHDIRDDAAHWVRRRPLTAIAIGVGAGVMLGIAAGVIAARFGARLAFRHYMAAGAGTPLEPSTLPGDEA